MFVFIHVFNGNIFTDVFAVFILLLILHTLLLFQAGRPGGSVGNLENLLTLGREFESRCSHTNWMFPQKMKNNEEEKMPNEWRTINSFVNKI